MNPLADFLYERDKLRAALRKWQWLFFASLALLILLTGKNYTKPIKTAESIARINLHGIIYHDQDLINKLKELSDNPKVKAVLLHIDSPGGTSFAGEELYVALKRLSKTKPVVSVLKTMAASGGYMAALASDYIVARNMTLTGSIGVIFQSFEAVELANKLGIKFISLKSSPLKASPNPMEIMDKEVEMAAMESVEDSYQTFLQIFMEGRKMKKEQALKLANGKVYTGMRAKKLNLIDEIGGEEEALMWLEKNKKIPASIKIEDINWHKNPSLLQELSQFFKYSNQILSNIFNQNNISILAK
jgi:protease-4